MTFAQQAVADLVGMHNLDEFAVALSINGAAAVPCILDEELTKIPTDGEGVRQWDATLHVPAASLPDAPVPDQRLEIGAYADVGGVTVPARSAIVLHTDTIHGERVIRLRWFES